MSPVRHIWLSATSVVAASELPPPSPPPIGMLFLMAISAPSPVPVAACRARAARTVRSSDSATPAGPAGRVMRAVVADADLDAIAQVDELKHRLQLVVAVGPAADDVQHEIEFGGRRATRSDATALTAASVPPAV